MFFNFFVLVYIKWLILKFFPNHLKTKFKKMGKQTVKNLIFVIRYLPDPYKMCNKAILEYSLTILTVTKSIKYVI